MRYLEIKFTTNPYSEIANDLLREFAAEAGCESFIDNSDHILGYAQTDAFDETTLKAMIKDFPMEGIEIKYDVHEAEYKNWNQKWEKESFQPIVIADKCIIHSTHHTDYPKLPIDIKIDPEMSFGSGTHETTSMMLTTMMELDMTGKRVLDMGCGTCILSIMASKLGAARVTAIDIDEWSVKNATKNSILNNADNIEVSQGTANNLNKDIENYHFILANINKNIILHDIKSYSECLTKNGQLLVSGFYLSDLPDIERAAEQNGLNIVMHRMRNEWCCALFGHKA